MSTIKRVLFLIGITILLSVSSYSQTVIIGNGTLISVFSPLNRTNDYCVYEIIYPATQIGLNGPVTALAFQRHDGTNVDSIENVSIYMKHTSATQIASGNYDTSGYTLVYYGSFPNDAGAGWREVALNGAFSYDGINNLQVLVSKGYQPAVANTPVTPRWIYDNINPTPARARRYYGDIAISSSTALTATQYSCNARLTFGVTGIAEIYSGQLSVYPNPSSGEINFHIDENAGDSELIIFNSAGQEVFRNMVSEDEIISFNTRNSGVYNYMLTGKSEVITRGRFVIM